MPKIISFLLISIFMSTFSFAEEAPEQNYPSVVVLIEDYIDGAEQKRNLAEIILEKALRENGFSVISKTQNVDIGALMPTFTPPPAEIAKIGKKYKADVIIIGRATSNKVDVSTPYEPGVIVYKALIEARAVKVKNARVIAMEKTISDARGGGRELIADKAIVYAAESLATGLIQKISDNWARDIYVDVNVEIICRNAPPEKAELLTRALGQTKNVRIISKELLQDSTVQINVRFLGTTNELVWLLARLLEPIFDIENYTPNRIDLYFITPNKDFTR